MTETRRLATIIEAAAHAHCSPVTIKRRLRDNTLTRYKLGRMTRVDLNELDAAFTAQPPTEQAS